MGSNVLYEYSKTTDYELTNVISFSISGNSYAIISFNIHKEGAGLKTNTLKMFANENLHIYGSMEAEESGLKLAKLFDQKLDASKKQKIWTSQEIKSIIDKIENNKSVSKDLNYNNFFTLGFILS